MSVDTIWSVYFGFFLDRGAKPCSPETEFVEKIQLLEIQLFEKNEKIKNLTEEVNCKNNKISQLERDFENAKNEIFRLNEKLDSFENEQIVVDDKVTEKKKNVFSKLGGIIAKK